MNPLSLFVLALFACNGASTPDLLDEESEDLPPQADAGPNQSGPADATVSLDGRASYDPNGSPLTFHWSFDSVPSGSGLLDWESPFSTNNDQSGVTAFQPDAVGVYIVALEVDDGGLRSTPAFAIVDVTDPESTPVADAGTDITIAMGNPALLDGSQSVDPLGGTLEYSWVLANVPPNSGLGDAALTGADQTSASFVPDVVGTYTATLVVSNGLTTSAPDAVVVTASGNNVAPTARVTESFAGEDCTPVPLDCSTSSDPEGAPLAYYWEIQLQPDGSSATTADFSDPDGATTDLWADAAGEWLVSCSVSDGMEWSNPAVVEISLSERANNGPPEIDAGPSTLVDAGSAPCTSLGGNQYDCESCPAVTTVLGTGGYTLDPDGDPLDLLWEIDSGNATLIDNDSLEVEVILAESTPNRPSQCVEDTYTFVLTATDCPGLSVSSEVSVRAQCCGVNGP